MTPFRINPKETPQQASQIRASAPMSVMTDDWVTIAGAVRFGSPHQLQHLLQDLLERVLVEQERGEGDRDGQQDTGDLAQ